MKVIGIIVEEAENSPPAGCIFMVIAIIGLCYGGYHTADYFGVFDESRLQEIETEKKELTASLNDNEEDVFYTTKQKLSRLKELERKESELKSKVNRSTHSGSSIKELQDELITLEQKIQFERNRWRAASNTINRLTNNKRTPVKEGSRAYHQCLEASKIMREIEEKAPKMNAQKSKLTNEINHIKEQSDL